ncbi:MAG: ABC transporter permease, partial [Pseudonocardiales bacterium]
MRLAEAWRVALDALRANRLRSALTMLGVVIGVLAVVLLVAIGAGAKQTVERQVQGLGSNLLLIVPGQLSFGQAPTTSRLQLSDVDEVARVVGDRNRVAASLSSGELVRAGTKRTFATVQGVTETTDKVFDRPVARGQFLSRSDVDTRRRVAVLGTSTARQLFGDRDPIGRQVSIAGVRFRVIGVFRVQGRALGVDQDLDV